MPDEEKERKGEGKNLFIQRPLRGHRNMILIGYLYFRRKCIFASLGSAEGGWLPGGLWLVGSLYSVGCTKLYMASHMRID